MALSEIIINDVVQYQTNKIISESNYPTLRQYLLERKPLSILTDAIEEILSSQYDIDKRTIIMELAQLAFDAQRASDTHEARSDDQEKINDSLMNSNYRQELSSIDNRQPQLETRIFQQQNYVNQIRSQISEYKINKDQAYRSIDRIRNERNIINSRYIINPTIPQTNVHVHGATPQTNVHVHGAVPQPTVHVHNATPTAVVFSFQDQLTWDNLIREENKLIDERQRLTRLIETKEADLDREEKQLVQLSAEKRQIDNRKKEITRQLETVLPNKEQQRQLRYEERIAREQARETDDPELLQLSTKNRDALKQRITAKIEELDTIRSQLMKNAVDSSYQVFLTQLDEALQGITDLQLSYGEREALKSITQMMNEYFEMEDQEQKIIHSLNEAKSSLKSLQKKLSDNTSQLKEYEASNPQLKITNKGLEEDNIRLKAASESAGSVRNTAIYCSLFGGTSSIASAAIIGSLLVSPVFFAISGVLALATVISLTVAAVYHYQKSTSDNQVDRNVKTIGENESIIAKNDIKAVELRTTTLPSLQTQIDESGKVISRIDKQLQDHQHAMRQLTTKAQNVIEQVSNHSNQFFRSATESVVPFRSSSPKFEDDSNPETTEYDFEIRYGQ